MCTYNETRCTECEEEPIHISKARLCRIPVFITWRGYSVITKVNRRIELFSFSRSGFRKTKKSSC